MQRERRQRAIDGAARFLLKAHPTGTSRTLHRQLANIHGRPLIRLRTLARPISGRGVLISRARRPGHRLPTVMAYYIIRICEIVGRAALIHNQQEPVPQGHEQFRPEATGQRPDIGDHDRAGTPNGQLGRAKNKSPESSTEARSTRQPSRFLLK